jgi:hypothetical protein
VTTAPQIAYGKPDPEPGRLGKLLSRDALLESVADLGRAHFRGGGDDFGD